MFGGYHAFIPALIGRLFRKKTFIILGGTDAVSFPSINYGTFRKKIQGKITCLAYRLSHRLLPVHKSLIYRSDTYYTEDSLFQGCKHWCKNLNTPFTEIPNGYDSAFWTPEIDRKVEKSFLTIAALPDPSKVVLKGIDLILEIAEIFPNASFTIIGSMPSYQIPNIPKNVLVIPFMSADGLRDIMRKSEFYLQLSISEGFPNALCEAMLVECIPIVSNVAAMPEIIGNTGWIIPKRNKDLLIETLREAINSQDKPLLAHEARKRISEKYPLELRKSLLQELL
jgi:glycosyltransferase involved in cell wall biosynthesis